MTDHLPPIVSSEYETRLLAPPYHGEPKDIITAQRDSGRIISDNGFTRNGSRIYLDGGMPELCFPECADPEQLEPYAHAEDQAYVGSLARWVEYLHDRAGTDRPVQVTYHRRNRDSYGRTWACHDNYSILPEVGTRYFVDAKENTFTPDTPAHFMLRYLATRAFMTGAGLVTPDGLRYSQKLDVLEHYHRLGNVNAYFGVKERQKPERFEVRLSERTINPHSTRLRVGGGAVMLALAQTDKIHALLDQTEYHEVLPRRLEHDALLLNPDGTVAPSPGMLAQADTQERFFTAADTLPDLPDVYRSIIADSLDYIARYRSLLRGDSTVHDLLAISDWAAKCVSILDHIAKNPTGRTLTDEKSQLRDLAYDMTVITHDGTNTRIIDGPGMKWYKAGRFENTPTEEAIAIADTTPPQNTRAKTRVEKLRAAKGNITSVDWDCYQHMQRPTVRFGPLRLDV